MSDLDRAVTAVIRECLAVGVATYGWRGARVAFEGSRTRSALSRRRG